MMPPGAVGNGQTRPISPPPGTPPRALHAEAPWAVTNAVYANVPASFGPLPTLSPPANLIAPGTPMAIQEVKPLATAKAEANVSRVFPGVRHGGDTLLDTFVPRHRANSSSQTVVGNHAPAATQKQQPQQHVDLVPAYPDDPQPQQHVDLVPAYPDDPQPAKAYIDAATVADVKQQAEARRAQDAQRLWLTTLPLRRRQLSVATLHLRHHLLCLTTLLLRQRRLRLATLHLRQRRLRLKKPPLWIFWI